jgi:hypothetical protein
MIHEHNKLFSSRNLSHCTYHRGQVASKLKRFGIEQPITDFFFWVIEEIPRESQTAGGGTDRRRQGWHAQSSARACLRRLTNSGYLGKDTERDTIHRLPTVLPAARSTRTSGSLSG